MAKRRTAFVPKIVFSTMFVGVVPAVAACGGDDSTGGGQAGTAVAGVALGGFGGVGVSAFGGAGNGGSGVADSGPRADADYGDATDSQAESGGEGGRKRDADIFGVAAGGFGVANPAFAGLPPAKRK